MEETIQRLQTLADRADKYSYPEDSKMWVRISDIRAVLEFYEQNKGEIEPPKNTNRITPDWHNLDKKYNWVAVGPDGIELAFIRKPHLYYDYMNQQNSWTGRVCVSTGRIFEMDNIDWMETRSKRPAK